VVAPGEALLAPTVTRRLISEFVRRREPTRRPVRALTGITDREREVLMLIARGFCNSEIEPSALKPRDRQNTHRPAVSQAQRQRLSTTCDR
jgi:FixJ family two-component response regulator